MNDALNVEMYLFHVFHFPQAPINKELRCLHKTDKTTLKSMCPCIYSYSLKNSEETDHN